MIELTDLTERKKARFLYKEERILCKEEINFYKDEINLYKEEINLYKELNLYKRREKVIQSVLKKKINRNEMVVI